MNSPKSVVSPRKTVSISMKQNSDHDSMAAAKASVGGLDVYIHQARDIHNVCIYHKQDVYAKVCLTGDSENKPVSTKVIYGGGTNPIFNESTRLNVDKLDSSLKCEIWMLSRMRNYLEDQLLGYVLVPVSEILLHDGKMEKEFALSSSDISPSRSGYVELSISYIGSPPEVVEIPALLITSLETDNPANHGSELSGDPLSNELYKVEFPDPKVVSETCQMVEEYIKMPHVNAEPLNSSNMVQREESFSPDSESSREHLKNDSDSPPRSDSVLLTSSVSVVESFGSSVTAKDSKFPNGDHNISSKQTDSEKVSGTTSGKPVVTVNIEPELKVVQQEIVDMYMKSMQQFTESLAKMKMNFDNGPTSLENSRSDQKPQLASKNSSSRVFYGSNAFF